MRISDAFPSTYLKAADLRGQNVNVVMSHVNMEEVGDGHKPIVYFQGKDKGLVLNKTNANNIVAAYGEDTDDWAGGKLILFPAMVDFQGKTVEAIRVRVPPRKPAAAAQRAQATTSDERNPPPNDDIPF